MKQIEWWAFTLTIISAALSAFAILPWNVLFGVLGCFFWCLYAFKEDLTAVFWINVIMGVIYLFGILGYYIT